MDLGLEVPSAEEEKELPQAKRQAVGSTAKDQTKVMELLLKASLSMFLAIRVLKSCVVETCLFKASHTMVVEGLKITKQYAIKAQNDDSGTTAKIGESTSTLVQQVSSQMVSHPRSVAGSDQECHRVHQTGSTASSCQSSSTRQDLQNVRFRHEETRVLLALRQPGSGYESVVNYLRSQAKADKKQGMVPPSELK